MDGHRFSSTWASRNPPPMADFVFAPSTARPVLVLLLATFVFMAAALRASWTQAVLVLLQGATLIAALSAVGVSPRLMRWPPT